MGTFVQPAIQKWGEGGTDLFVFGFQEIVSLDARNLFKDTSKGLFQSSAAMFGDVSSILAGQDVDRGPKVCPCTRFGIPGSTANASMARTSAYAESLNPEAIPHPSSYRKCPEY